LGGGRVRLLQPAADKGHQRQHHRCIPALAFSKKFQEACQRLPSLPRGHGQAKAANSTPGSTGPPDIYQDHPGGLARVVHRGQTICPALELLDLHLKRSRSSHGRGEQKVCGLLIPGYK
jgi:hypothetical protein